MIRLLGVAQKVLGTQRRCLAHLGREGFPALLVA